MIVKNSCFIVLALFLFGCSTVKPIERFSEPKNIRLEFKSGISAKRAMEIIEYDLGSATGIKDKARFNQTKDIRVPRPDLVLGKEVFKDCISETNCVVTFVFHKGQYLGETKRYDTVNDRLVATSGNPKITGEATTKQTIKIPVVMSKSTSGNTVASVYIDGKVEYKKYEGVFGLTNIISGKTYSPLLSSDEVTGVIERFKKISPPEAILLQ